MTGITKRQALYRVLWTAFYDLFLSYWSVLGFRFYSHYRTARVHRAPEKQEKYKGNGIQIQIQLHLLSDSQGPWGTRETRQIETGRTTQKKKQFSPASNEEAKPLQKTSIESLWYHHVSGESQQLPAEPTMRLKN